jgi:hypothetical protein
MAPETWQNFIKVPLSEQESGSLAVSEHFVPEMHAQKTFKYDAIYLSNSDRLVGIVAYDSVSEANTDTINQLLLEEYQLNKEHIDLRHHVIYTGYSRTATNSLFMLTNAPDTSNFNEISIDTYFRDLPEAAPSWFSENAIEAYFERKPKAFTAANLFTFGLANTHNLTNELGTVHPTGLVISAPDSVYETAKADKYTEVIVTSGAITWLDKNLRLSMLTGVGVTNNHNVIKLSDVSPTIIEITLPETISTYLASSDSYYEKILTGGNTTWSRTRPDWSSFTRTSATSLATSDDNSTVYTFEPYSEHILYAGNVTWTPFNLPMSSYTRLFGDVVIEPSPETYTSESTPYLEIIVTSGSIVWVSGSALSAITNSATTNDQTFVTISDTSDRAVHITETLVPETVPFTFESFTNNHSVAHIVDTVGRQVTVSEHFTAENYSANTFTVTNNVSSLELIDTSTRDISIEEQFISERFTDISILANQPGSLQVLSHYVSENIPGPMNPGGGNGQSRESTEVLLPYDIVNENRVDVLAITTNEIYTVKNENIDLRNKIAYVGYTRSLTNSQTSITLPFMHGQDLIDVVVLDSGTEIITTAIELTVESFDADLAERRFINYDTGVLYTFGTPSTAYHTNSFGITGMVPQTRIGEVFLEEIFISGQLQQDPAALTEETYKTFTAHNIHTFLSNNDDSRTNLVGYSLLSTETSVLETWQQTLHTFVVGQPEQDPAALTEETYKTFTAGDTHIFLSNRDSSRTNLLGYVTLSTNAGVTESWQQSLQLGPGIVIEGGEFTNPALDGLIDGGGFGDSATLFMDGGEFVQTVEFNGGTFTDTIFEPPVDGGSYSDPQDVFIDGGGFITWL